MQHTRVVVGAGRTLFRQGLAALIAAETGFVVVGEAADADALRRLAEREQPDLILVDSDLPCPEGGCDFIACVRATCGQAQIVVLGEADRAVHSEAEAESALRAEREHALLQGASAYLPARADAQELLRLLTALSPIEAGGGQDTVNLTPPVPRASGSAGPATHQITERERAIIAMIAQGLCNKEVAYRLGNQYARRSRTTSAACWANWPLRIVLSSPSMPWSITSSFRQQAAGSRQQAVGNWD